MQSSVLSMGCMCACSTMQSKAPGCAASTVAGCSVQLSALRLTVKVAQIIVRNMVFKHSLSHPSAPHQTIDAGWQNEMQYAAE